MDLFRSLLPLYNPIGFGAADFLLLALALLLFAVVLLRARCQACGLTPMCFHSEPYPMLMR